MYVCVGDVATQKSKHKIQRFVIVFLLLSVQSYMALSTENGTPNYHQHCIYCDHIPMVYYPHITMFMTPYSRHIPKANI